MYAPVPVQSILLRVSGLKGIDRGLYRVSIMVWGILGSSGFRVQGFLGLRGLTFWGVLGLGFRLQGLG